LKQPPQEAAFLLEANLSSTFTPNYGVELQGTGDNAGTWGAELNNNVFSLFDSSLGNALILNVSGGSTTLNSAQMNNIFFAFQGTLLSDQTIIFPQIFRPLIIRNTTTGSFNLTIKTSNISSAVTTIYQGTTAFYYLSPSGFNSLADVYATSASTPGNLPMYNDTSGRALVDSGVAPPVIANTAQAQAGLSNTVYNSPLATTIQINARLASQGQAQGGTDNGTLMTPLRTSQAIQVQATPIPNLSTNPNTTDFPIGTTLLADGLLSRCQPTLVWTQASDGSAYTVGGGSNQLIGTWVCRGRVNSSVILVQRVI
jgi:hypothetical protein